MSKDNHSNKDSHFLPVIVSQFEVASKDILDTSVFSNSVPIEPTLVWHQRNAKLMEQQGVTKTSWHYQFPTIQCDWIEDAVRDILKVFVPIKNSIIQIKEEYGLDTYEF